jgi:FkbH-like protein
MELCNLVDGLNFKIDNYDDNQFDEILNKAKTEIDLVFENLKNSSLVLFNKFSTISIDHLNSPVSGKIDKLALLLNDYLESKQVSNVKLIQTEKVIANVGIEQSVSLRFYYSSKALYTVNFFKSYVNFVQPIILAANGKTKKALIFDCDNTLWKGILGEDGFDNIQMSQHANGGKYFYEVQTLALALSKQGVLLGLCSKNNAQDVDEVLLSHPDILIKNEDIVIKKVNWSDKASNLREIAQELNIGLDSIVFVDDSDFEINLIKEQLPEITALQVPKNLYEYPKLIKEQRSLFYRLSYSKEDLVKSKMYKEQVQRENEKSNFGSFEEYLISLELSCTIELDNTSLIPRISQLTQKTNQFNLTTLRYTEKDIENFISDKNVSVYTWSVSDKYGDYGLTGLCIVKKDPEKAEVLIDTFLMSCRIIGRNIEFAILDFIIGKLKGAGIQSVKSNYIKTLKNNQVANFFIECSFNITEQLENEIRYILNIDQYKYKSINYIKINYGR